MRHERHGRTRIASPLAGLIFDAQDRPMSPAFAYGKGGRRYRYYVSADLQQGAAPALPDEVRRVPGAPLEVLMMDRLQRLLQRSDLSWEEARLSLRRVQLRAWGVEVRIDPQALGQTPAALLQQQLPQGDRLEEQGGEVCLSLPVRPVFRGGRTWLVTPDGSAGLARARVDPALTKALWQGHRELARVKASPLTPVEQTIHAEGVPDSYLRRLAPLAFLAPDIQRAILEGRQPPGLTLQQMIDRDLPLAWADQRQHLGFAPVPDRA